MATITLTDGGSYISVQYSADHIVTVPKLGLKTKLKNGELLLYWDSAWENKAGRPWIQLDPDDISSPVVANVAALRTLILGWIETEPTEEGGGSSTYVGLPSNGDFITAYTAATQITFSGLPSDVTNIVDENIEIVRQINTGGEVVATYEREDAAMTVAANVLTITGATFTNTDTFVVFTNIPRPDSGSGASAGVAPSYIGKNGGINADFTVAYTAATQITLSGFTFDVTQIYESDIERIRQCTVTGALVAEWSHANSTINDDGSSLITVTEATFGAADLFTVFTNIPRVPDINVDMTSVSGNYLIGKDASATNADFTTADNGTGNDILLSGYPDYAAGGFTDDDIEFVRQINNTGAVVAIYSRDDATMVLAANVLTITGAVFAATDTYIVGTNVPRRDLDLPDLEFSTNYIGKLTGGNGDFDISYDGATTLDIDTFPSSSITALVAADIGLIRQMTVLGVWVADYTPYNATITIAGDVITVAEAVFGATDIFLVYTTIARPSGGGGGGIEANYKIGSWDGTVNFASTTTLTLAGAYPTINFDSQIIYIKYTDTTLNTAGIFRNGIDGILIEHAGGTLTLVNAGAPFAATNDGYEVGISSTPIGLDIGNDAQKTLVQNMEAGHYTDVEHIVEESDLGIDGTHDGGASATVFTDTGETYTAESVAEGYLIYNVSDTESAIITAGAGAGTPTADDITHAALGGAAQWAGAETASIPECKRFEIDAKSFNSGSIQAKITAGAANKVFLTVWASNNADADTTDDTDWIDVSTPCLGAVDINATASSTTEGIYPLRINANVEKYPVLKWMIKIVAECSDGVQSNSFDVYLIKST